MAKTEKALAFGEAVALAVTAAHDLGRLLAQEPTGPGDFARLDDVRQAEQARLARYADAALAALRRRP